MTVFVFSFMLTSGREKRKRGKPVKRVSLIENAPQAVFDAVMGRR
ncbi:MAG: hypothetical protein HSCHL_2417 [Hydrogenibacillus schlegelii]|uniref:Uncharacterized protein n=1 Tax=Hydrogenibacillus schlegelii TaxID=1484 RepID=A0A2T5G9S8_HYDSH|nr:MAG: hypothetical protein HSCHL_2417 [Hydrogenibacillus schlegelii]